MRTNTLALGLALLDFANSIHLLASRKAAPRVLRLDTQRKEIRQSPHVRDRLRKRASTLSVPLTNAGSLYYANVTIGTPAQALYLDIDTGSSDLWTNVASSQICQAQGHLCDVSGTYSANDSSTYQYLNSDFEIKYADGSQAVGDYATDTLRIGGTDVESLQFGIGYNSSSQNGILGVGYVTNEVQIQYTGSSYRNLPAQLVEQNTISSNAYSLWLNDLEANTGTILFGGVDSDKYTGDLETLPIVKEQGQYREFVIVLTSLAADGDTIFSDQAIPVLLDSGSSLSYLPDDYVQTIYDKFDANYNDQEGTATVDCSLADSDATVDFTFSSPKISVPMNELVVPSAIRGGQTICILGISPAGDSTSVLGDTFLRSAYVVYDLDNNEISLAHTNFNATSTNVREITSSVPGAAIVSGAVSTAAVGTGGARLGGQTGSAAAGGHSDMLSGAFKMLLCSTVAVGSLTMGASLIML